MTHADHSHAALANASLFKVIGTGLLLGFLHVITGPDHLSALAAMTSTSSWRSFWLGIRWGCGHSTGLVIMAIIIIVADRSIDFSRINGYVNYGIGVLMILLGLYSIYQSIQKRKPKSASSSLLKTDSVEGQGSCASSIYFVTDNEASDSEVLSGNESTPNAKLSKEITDSYVMEETGNENVTVKDRLEHPLSQKLTALCVGICHGIAGPGGALGVLPAVSLRNPITSSAYLGAFCIASILTMAFFAAIYGECTARITGKSVVLELVVNIVSAFFSVVIGVLWIVLQALGILDQIFE
uniref:Uncharacterized protein AlNc14C209G8894 n=1 Tax=Albugo laibachii Nc14 TaxID=890382 RepID=F0WR87_9STRA|nr:conserved hypothetical protein [Albugo laibachii Nc14]|eukprot:CCA23848.1 conserved hypothetical protein [Albugo laibachii Nc14]